MPIFSRAGLLSGLGMLLSLAAQAQTPAAPKEAPVYKASLDTAFQKGSGLVLSKLTAQQLENLTALGQVWGFVKYYHPVVAAGQVDWDKELFRVLPAALASRTTAERSALLGQWIAKLGPAAPCATCAKRPALPVRQEPDLVWLTDNRLYTAELQQQLDYLKHNRNQGSHYYVAEGNVLSPGFTHEEAYATHTYPDAGLRILALFRYWNMIQYFFPYKYAIGENWQQVLPEFLPQFVEAPNALQYRLVTLRLLARIHDGHATLNPDATLDQYMGAYIVPAAVKFIDRQAVVLRVRQDGLLPRPPLEPGDILTHIDGVSVVDIVKQRLPLTPGSNEAGQLRMLASDLLRGNTDQTQLQLLRAGKPLTVSAPRYLLDKLPPVRPQPADSAYRFLKPDIGYLTMAKTKQQQLPTIFRTFKNTKGLVVDIRNYPTDFSATQQLPGYFLTKPKAFAKFAKFDISYPGRFLRFSSKFLKPIGTPYTGKLIVLVDETSISLAEYTAMALRATPHAIILGSPTAGADGDVSRIVLPGNLVTRISGTGVYYPDGRETQRIGIVPDVQLRPTVQGIREGRDELLEKALELIDKG
ncbi:S41 family peptidase [Hymenobacter wooponensis]|nr:S41 family peptidase [Hymenobacter wooponensis]